MHGINVLSPDFYDCCPRLHIYYEASSPCLCSNSSSQQITAKPGTARHKSHNGKRRFDILHHPIQFMQDYATQTQSHHIFGHTRADLIVIVVQFSCGIMTIASRHGADAQSSTITLFPFPDAPEPARTVVHPRLPVQEL